MTHTITVSGKTFGGCLDPSATGVPDEIGLPEPTVRQVGRGTQWTYHNLTDYQRDEMLHHMWLVGTCFIEGSADDPESRAEGRAILKDWEKNR